MATSDDHALLLQISYDLNRLQSQGRKAMGVVDGDLSAIEKRAKRTALELEESLSLKNVKLGSALTLGLGGLKEAASEEGTKALGPLGAAIGALGPLGFAAAAGLGAAAAAMERGMKAAEWAEDLEHASRALGLTTTQLQEFDFIANSIGIPVDKMRESMGGLASAIGLVESGLARSMSVKAFTDGLKITPAQLRGWGDLEHQLPHILDAMSKLNVEERAGLAQRLKIDPDVLNSLIEAREDLNALREKAKELGIVMDAETVKKTAEAARQMKIAGAVISGELNIAFAKLAPLAASAADKLVRITTAVADIARGIGDALGPIDRLIEKLGHIPGLGAAPGQVTNSILGALGPAGALIQGANALGAAGAADRHAAAARLGAEPTTGAGGPPAVELSHTAPKGKHQAKGEDDLDQADKLLADAEKALAKSIEARAAFEAKALDAEQAKAAKKLADDLKAAKSPTERAQIEAAQAETARAFALKKQLLSDQTAQALADQANAMAEIGLKGQEERLHAEQELGVSARRRGEIELQLFDLDEQIVRNKLAETLASRTASDAEKARAAAELANLDATAPSRRQAVANRADQGVADEANSLAELRIDGEKQVLEAERGVFQTTETRRAIALKLFALDEQLQELKLQEIVASKTATQAEKDRAQAELANLRATLSLRQEAVSQANPGNSWSAWLQDARASISDVGEEFAKMKVDGIDAFNASLFTSEGRLNSWSNIARSVARRFITDFEQMGTKTVESLVLGNGQAGTGLVAGLGALASGKGAGGFFGSLFGGLSGGQAKPDGSAGNPFFTKSADGAAGGAGGLLSGLFGGGQGAGAAGGGGGLFGWIKGLFGGGGAGLGAGFGGGAIPAFAGGGQFTVAGQGGIDKNLAAMRVSRGERITVETPAQQAAADAARGPTYQSFNFPNASIDGFKRSQRQLARSARMATQAGA